LSEWRALRGYFEETNLAPIRVGDRAQIKLMAYSQVVRGHIESIARAINVSNSQPNNHRQSHLHLGALSPAYSGQYPCR
jgi:multidrug resistance efflux pump